MDKFLPSMCGVAVCIDGWYCLLMTVQQVVFVGKPPTRGSRSLLSTGFGSTDTQERRPHSRSSLTENSSYFFQEHYHKQSEPKHIEPVVLQTPDILQTHALFTETEANLPVEDVSEMPLNDTTLKAEKHSTTSEVSTAAISSISAAVALAAVATVTITKEIAEATTTTTTAQEVSEVSTKETIETTPSTVTELESTPEPIQETFAPYDISEPEPTKIEHYEVVQFTEAVEISDISEPIEENVSQVQVVEVDEVVEVAEVVEVDEVFEVTKVFEVNEVVEVTKVFEVNEVVEVTKVVEVDMVDEVKVPEIAEISEVSESENIVEPTVLAEKASEETPEEPVIAFVESKVASEEEALLTEEFKFSESEAVSVPEEVFTETSIEVSVEIPEEVAPEVAEHEVASETVVSEQEELEASLPAVPQVDLLSETEVDASNAIVPEAHEVIPEAQEVQEVQIVQEVQEVSEEVSMSESELVVESETIATVEAVSESPVESVVEPVSEVVEEILPSTESAIMVESEEARDTQSQVLSHKEVHFSPEETIRSETTNNELVSTETFTQKTTLDTASMEFVVQEYETTTVPLVIPTQTVIVQVSSPLDSEDDSSPSLAPIAEEDFSPPNSPSFSDVGTTLYYHSPDKVAQRHSMVEPYSSASIASSTSQPSTPPANGREGSFLQVLQGGSQENLFRRESQKLNAKRKDITSKFKRAFSVKRKTSI
ncbi:hypothetical protein BDF14DRAFT_1745384 [Spinellus fusiger]|nr:hypothetical protein BDF14DRAFT_1745384 [Spinellus fusiger]